MKDPYQEMLAEVLSLTLAGLVILVMVALAGCAPTVKHEVPQLDRATDVIRKIVVQDCQKPTLAMPPIPENCIIDIRGDSLTASSKECEDLVRFYVAARRLLKPAAPPSSTPTASP